MARDSAGNLYGTTIYGGDFSGICPFYGCGVVFKVDKAGKEEVLYAFPDGADQDQFFFPTPGVILDEAGNLYGTYAWGGFKVPRCYDHCGFVYMIQP